MVFLGIRRWNYNINCHPERSEGSLDSSACGPQDDRPGGLSDLESEGGVQQVQLVTFKLYFITDPRKAGPKIKGIDIQKFVLFF
jgi:hypothetical protein